MGKKKNFIIFINKPLKKINISEIKFTFVRFSKTDVNIAFFPLLVSCDLNAKVFTIFKPENGLI